MALTLLISDLDNTIAPELDKRPITPFLLINGISAAYGFETDSRTTLRTKLPAAES